MQESGCFKLAVEFGVAGPDLFRQRALDRWLQGKRRCSGNHVGGVDVDAVLYRLFGIDVEAEFYQRFRTDHGGG